MNNNKVSKILNAILSDIGVCVDDGHNSEQNVTRENKEFMIFRCRSADDMMSVLNSICEEGLYDKK